MVQRRHKMKSGNLMVTDELFKIINYDDWQGSIEQWAMKEWLNFHGIDESDVPIDSPVHRKEDTHTVTYLRVVRDEDGKLMRDPMDPRQFLVIADTEQSEAGPLRWPEEILTHMEQKNGPHLAEDQDVARYVSRRIGEANRSTSTFEGPGDGDV